LKKLDNHEICIYSPKQSRPLEWKKDHRGLERFREQQAHHTRYKATNYREKDNQSTSLPKNHTAGP
jgi:hypothetical protein